MLVEEIVSLFILQIIGWKDWYFDFKKETYGNIQS
jgi:hypothetical protein